MDRNIALMLAAALLVMAEPAAAAWKTLKDGPTLVAEGTARTPGAVLRIYCPPATKNAVWLEFFPPRGWRGDLKAIVRVGAATTPMEIDGTDISAILSNRPDKKIGITPALFDAIRSGETLVIEGPAAVKVPAARRTFPLAGIVPALAAVERTCPGFR